MRPLRLLCLALFVLVLLPAAPAMAATFNVTTTLDADDDAPGNGICKNVGTNDCSLRSAIQEANTLAGTDEIVVPAGTYAIAQTGTPDDNASDNDLDLTQSVTIRGAGAGSTFIDGDGIDRVFHVTTGSVNAQLSGLTIRGGTAQSSAPGGGGVLNSGNLTISDSQVVDNELLVGRDGAGIYNQAGATVSIIRTLVARNVNNNDQGGGLYNNGGNVSIQGSTFSGNSAQDGGAIYGVVSTLPSMSISYSTITANATVGGNGVVVRGNGSNTITGSIIAGNSGANDCSGNSFNTTSYSIESGTSCGLVNSAQGDRQNVTSLGLGALADNGGQSFTHLPQTGSPAIDGGPASGCANFDQRGLGFTRPSGSACDIGAVEIQVVPPPPPPPPPPPVSNDPVSIELDIAQVTRTPGDPNIINATIKRKDGSPGAGVEARYVVSGANPVSGLIKGDNNGVASNGWPGVHDGADIYTVWLDLNGNAALDPGEPSDSATVMWVLPTPQVAKTVNVEPISGTVLVRLPSNAKIAKHDAWAQAAQARYVPLKEAKNVPVGSILDTRKGTVELTSSASQAKPTLTQTAQFYSGAFEIRQVRAAHPVTELRMSESLACPKGSSSKVIAARAKTRKLWGKGKGRFRTRGRHSSASVRGTTWYSKDDCKKTTTVVREGSVVVQDFGKKKNIRLTATGTNRYVAKPATKR